MNQLRSRDRASRGGAGLLAALVACCMAVIPAEVQGQARDSVEMISVDGGRERAAQPLDAAVDRATYRLGPGDRVIASLFGDINRMWQVTVSPDGTIAVPTIGVVRVLDATLDEAQQLLQREVGRLYRGVSARLTLAELRTFKVYVLGDIAQPGVRSATPAMRVSEVIQRRDDTTASPGVKGVIPRNISLRRGRDTISIDLVPFFHTGSVASNPSLREGDVVYLPTLDHTVRAWGRVSYPGVYEYRVGETLAGFLDLVNGGGPFPADAADTVRVNRPFPGGRHAFLFSLAESRGGRGGEFRLEPWDEVFVAGTGNFMLRGVARVEGQVRHPGVYPVEPGVTTLRDLVTLAGGFLPDASLDRTTLRRAPLQARVDSVEIPTQALSEQEQRVRLIRLGDDETNVVVDLPRLFAPGATDPGPRLLDGDVLKVPRRRNEVVVLGAVRQPGMVQHERGGSVDFYLARAGGVSDRADRRAITVFRGKLGTELEAAEVSELEPGDQIVVPFKRHRTLLERIQVVGGVTSVVSGIIFTIYALDQLFGKPDAAGG